MDSGQRRGRGVRAGSGAGPEPGEAAEAAAGDETGRKADMKTIGLLGGMSWESTVTYYQIINETVKRESGRPALREDSPLQRGFCGD